jgi:hypothetical protein
MKNKNIIYYQNRIENGDIPDDIRKILEEIIPQKEKEKKKEIQKDDLEELPLGIGEPTDDDNQK